MIGKMIIALTGMFPKPIHMEIIDDWNHKNDCYANVEHYLAVSKSGNLYVVYNIGEERFNTNFPNIEWRVCRFN